MSELRDFAQRLAQLKLTETECGIALLWFFDHFEPGCERTARALAAEMNEQALRSSINIPRFKTNMQKSGQTVKGSGADTFKLKLSARQKLNDKYADLLKRQVIHVDDHVLETSDFDGTRPYFVAIAAQINGCYQYGFYDACLAMCRRLAESLLIEVFESKGAANSIKDSKGDYLMFGPIIDKAKSGQFFKLPRGVDNSLDTIKRIGDIAAHSRAHIFRQRDADHVKLDFRRAISELMTLAGLRPAP